jgi:hypothetical protein
VLKLKNAKKFYGTCPRISSKKDSMQVILNYHIFLYIIKYMLKKKFLCLPLMDFSVDRLLISILMNYFM